MQLLLDKVIGDLIPPSFILFGFVGSIGAAVHLSILWLLLFISGVRFGNAQIIATVAAMIVNFLLKNAITYRDRRLKARRSCKDWFRSAWPVRWGTD